MTMTILITGATDGLGLAAAKQLAALGHSLILHGRSAEKLARAQRTVAKAGGGATVNSYVADLSEIAAVDELASSVLKEHTKLDVLINNAGVFQVAEPVTDQGFDVRFLVNAVAPYRLTTRLLPLMSHEGRVVNLSSAAQAPVSLDALRGSKRLGDSAAYAQSKLAITMWSFAMASELSASGPSVIALNPGSLLATKMVQEAYGQAGADLQIGVDVLIKAALGKEFANASGRYFDNDQERFNPPHADALDAAKNAAIVAAIEAVILQLTGNPASPLG